MTLTAYVVRYGVTILCHKFISEMDFQLNGRIQTTFSTFSTMNKILICLLNGSSLQQAMGWGSSDGT
jgi:hypothetical protein